MLVTGLVDLIHKGNIAEFKDLRDQYVTLIHSNIRGQIFLGAENITPRIVFTSFVL